MRKKNLCLILSITFLSFFVYPSKTYAAQIDFSATIQNWFHEKIIVIPTPPPIPDSPKIPFLTDDTTPTKTPLPDLIQPTSSIDRTPTISSDATPEGITEPKKIRTNNPSPTSHSADLKKEYIMRMINTYRSQYDLAPVQTDPYTCSFAKIRAKEITTDFSHKGFQIRIQTKSLPYPRYTAVTENLAMTSDYKNVVNLWAKSSGHAANMRKNTPFVCVEYYGNYYAYEGWRP